MKSIFLHIPKAGGTTIHSVINRIYPKNSVFDMVIRNGKRNLQEFIDLPNDEKQNLQILKGHFVFGLHQHFPEPNQVKYFTFLRNPASRIISQYSYILSRKDHYLYNPIIENKMSLEDFALSDLSIELDNGQVRLISGFNSQNVNETNKLHLEAAKQNIEKHFITVGFVERFNESLILLKEKMNWDNYPYYRHLNESKEKIKVEERVKEAINNRNILDVQLYDWALKKFEEDKNQIQGFENKIEILKQSILAFQDGHLSGFNLSQKSFATRKSRLDKLFTLFKIK